MVPSDPCISIELLNHQYSDLLHGVGYDFPTSSSDLMSDLRILILLELERDLRDHLLLCHNIIEVVLMAFGDESFHLP